MRTVFITLLTPLFHYGFVYHFDNDNIVKLVFLNLCYIVILYTYYIVYPED